MHRVNDSRLSAFRALETNRHKWLLPTDLAALETSRLSL
jgi:hypothetical protein